MKPLFSIIVPAYNVESYIQKCIESILDQTLNCFQLIIVDDGSVDGTAEICDRYANNDDRITVIHQNNQGIVLARQNGVENAIADYLVFVDGDDYLDCCFLSKFETVLKKYNCDVVCCDYFEAYGDKNILVKNKCKDGFFERNMLIKDVFPSLILNENGEAFPAQVWAKAFKKKVYDAHQLKNVKVEMGEDIACTYSTIGNSNSMYILHEPLYFYRQNQSSTTKRKKVFSWDGLEIRHNHLINHLNIEDFDFKKQIYRNTLLGAFTVSRSQLYDDASEKEKRKNIIDHLKSQFYRTIIKNADFRPIKLKLIKLCLKYRLVLLMCLYNWRH